MLAVQGEPSVGSWQEPGGCRRSTCGGGGGIKPDTLDGSGHRKSAGAV